ncbi:MAG TPA: hypothetical protein VGM30_16435 [Puia sp.]|jgi:hypothetical protein
MRSLLAILLLLSAGEYGLRAQDLTGQWTGSATDNLSEKKQKLVLTITEADSAIGGVLHWYFPDNQYISHLIVSGRFYRKDSVLTIREDSAVDQETTGTTDNGGMTGRTAREPAQNPANGFYTLYYRRTAAHKDVLEGHWRNPRSRHGDKDGNLTIRLEKKAPPFIPVPVVNPTHKKKDSAQIKQYHDLQDRQSVVAATIPMRGADSATITLYDNGEIDGDSVSLYLNGELLLQHLRLTAQPKVLTISIDKSLPVNKLVLFAENLGRLPPNTALMEVSVRGKTYDLFLSTDYKRNASVEFTLQE